MEIYMINPGKIKVFLSKPDMERLNITMESFDYLSPTARRSILRILSEAKQTTGFEPEGTKLYIEAFPGERGGCVLLLSSAPEERGMMETVERAPSGPVLFGFDDMEVLITASCKLFRQYCHRVYKSSLYRMQDMYVLVVYPLDKVDRLTVNFLCEYGTKIGEGVVHAAVAEEHGEPIILENAVDVISACMDDTL